MRQFYVYRGSMVSAEVFARKNSVEDQIVQKCYEIFNDSTQPPMAKQRAALNIRSLTQDNEPISRWRQTHEKATPYFVASTKKSDPRVG